MKRTRGTFHGSHFVLLLYSFFFIVSSFLSFDCEQWVDGVLYIRVGRVEPDHDDGDEHDNEDDDGGSGSGDNDNDDVDVDKEDDDDDDGEDCVGNDDDNDSNEEYRSRRRKNGLSTSRFSVFLTVGFLLFRVLLPVFFFFHFLSLSLARSLSLSPLSLHTLPYYWLLKTKEKVRGYVAARYGDYWWRAAAGTRTCDALCERFDVTLRSRGAGRGEGVPRGRGED